MGLYVPELAKYRLRFERHPGLEVVTRRVTVDGIMEFVALAEGLDGLSSENAGTEELAKVGRLFDRFAGVLLEWNVGGEDGKAVPATREGIGSQDFQFVMEIITAWIGAVSQAPPPLPQSSSGGPPDPVEASIPMENPPSSPGPS